MAEAFTGLKEPTKRKLNRIFSGIYCNAGRIQLGVDLADVARRMVSLEQQISKFRNVQ